MTKTNLGCLDRNGQAFVWVKRKAPAAVCIKKGEFTANSIMVPEAIDVLEARTARAGADGLLFPDWDPRKASEVVKATAKACKWDDSVVWNGAHNARHGAARDAFDSCLADVMDTGMWDSVESAKRYGAPREAQALMEARSKALAAAKARRKAGAGSHPTPAQAAAAKRRDGQPAVAAAQSGGVTVSQPDHAASADVAAQPPAPSVPAATKRGRAQEQTRRAREVLQARAEAPTAPGRPLNSFCARRQAEPSSSEDSDTSAENDSAVPSDADVSAPRTFDLTQWYRMSRQVPR